MEMCQFTSPFKATENGTVKPFSFFFLPVHFDSSFFPEVPTVEELQSASANRREVFDVTLKMMDLFDLYSISICRFTFILFLIIKQVCLGIGFIWVAESVEETFELVQVDVSEDEFVDACEIFERRIEKRSYHFGGDFRRHSCYV